jgi:hypothetical protein
VDLDGLVGRPGAVGGDPGWAGPLAPEACRRLACDGALTRVLVTHGPAEDLRNHDHDRDPSGHHDHEANGHRHHGDPGRHQGH